MVVSLVLTLEVDLAEELGAKRGALAMARAGVGAAAVRVLEAGMGLGARFRLETSVGGANAGGVESDINVAGLTSHLLLLFCTFS